jgi:hypothetical protein
LKTTCGHHLPPTDLRDVALEDHLWVNCRDTALSIDGASESLWYMVCGLAASWLALQQHKEMVSGHAVRGGRQSFYRCNIAKELAALDGECYSTHVDSSSVMILLKQQFINGQFSAGSMNGLFTHSAPIL